MKDFLKKPLNIIALILMVLNLVNYLGCGYGLAENRARYAAQPHKNTENMHLTLKEDTSFDEGDETIFISKGTVIKPENFITFNRIGFYYSTKGYNIEECKSASEREEKGFRYLSIAPQSFEEYEELEKLWNEEVKRVSEIRTKTILKIFIPVLCIGLVWLAGWFFLTKLLCGKKMYVLLYLMDLILLVGVYIGFSTSLMH